ncbi:MAG: hypothetical protein U5K54_27000 [Cytophagales bacterium]|nr:hypothetical protein [Cytophagales bacterium]
MPTLSFEEAFIKDMKAHAEKNFAKMKDKWAEEGQTLSALSLVALHQSFREVI